MSDEPMKSADSSDEGLAAELQANFAADPTPEHGEAFWQTLRNELDFEVAADSTGIDVHEVPVDASPTNDLAAERSRRAGRSSAKPMVGAVAACMALIVGGMFIARSSDRDRTSVVASPSQVDSADGRADVRLSPLVTLAEDLQSTDLEPLFTVQSTASSAVYHRLTSLDQLQSSGVITDAVEYEPAPDPWPEQDEYVPGSQIATYMLTEAGLNLSWLPVPANTIFIDGPGREATSFAAETGSWIADRDVPVRAYSATFSHDGPFGIPIGDPVSVPGTLDEPIRIEAPRQPVEADPVTLELPDNIRSAVGELAASLTHDEESDFDRAAALETYFREIFTLDLEAASITTQPFEEFLDRRTGNPEHFSVTFVAMVRSLGIPARAVVGFLPGEKVEGQPANQAVTRVVRQRDAHAWAEVHINGQWIRFDPTPGRGISTGSPERPIANRDHWHAPYAIYDCRSGSYQQMSMSTLDPLGIHSHQDGVIHIHPFFESSAGENAQFGVFLDSIEAELDDTGFASPDGQLPAAASCEGGDAVLHLRKWQFDFVIDSAEPEIFVDDIGAVRFENDREVYLLALAPVDGDLPPFPAERLDTLNQVAGAITSDGQSTLSGE